MWRGARWRGICRRVARACDAHRATRRLGASSYNHRRRLRNHGSARAVYLRSGHRVPSRAAIVAQRAIRRIVRHRMAAGQSGRRSGRSSAPSSQNGQVSWRATRSAPTSRVEQTEAAVGVLGAAGPGCHAAVSTRAGVLADCVASADGRTARLRSRCTREATETLPSRSSRTPRLPYEFLGSVSPPWHVAEVGVREATSSPSSAHQKSLAHRYPRLGGD